MRTEVLSVDVSAPDSAAVERAAELLRQGDLVAFPTETVYGLGAVATNSRAVSAVFAAKGRPAQNPLIVHIADIAAAQELVTLWPETAARLAARFWPGPLTLVLPKRPVVPDIVTGGGSTVALRLPAHPVALALLRAARLPLAAPSANRSNRLSPTRASHVLRDLSGRIPLILDGGPTTKGLESTVLDLTTTPPRLLRPGPLSPAEIEAEIGLIGRSGPRVSPGASPLPSPGMLTRHYAPRTPLECYAADEAGARVEALCRSGRKAARLVFSGTDQNLPGVITRVMPREPEAYAAELFTALHALDEAGADCIVVALPPETEEWLAVHDRLRRASAVGDCKAVPR